MEKCKCWQEEHAARPFASGRCSGTKELDFCDCGGDETKCDFYPEKRKKALEEKGELKPCPFCGGEVTIAETGYKNEKCFFVTRGHSKARKNCKCRVFMESEPYRKDEGDSKEKIRNDLVEAWNRRVNDE